MFFVFCFNLLQIPAEVNSLFTSARCFYSPSSVTPQGKGLCLALPAVTRLLGSGFVITARTVHQDYFFVYVGLRSLGTVRAQTPSTQKSSCPQLMPCALSSHHPSLALCWSEQNGILSIKFWKICCCQNTASPQPCRLQRGSPG